MALNHLVQSVEQINNNEYKIKLNYYADYLNMFKTKSIEYNVSYSTDGKIKVLSTKETSF